MLISYGVCGSSYWDEIIEDIMEELMNWEGCKWCNSGKEREIVVGEAELTQYRDQLSKSYWEGLR